MENKFDRDKSKNHIDEIPIPNFYGEYNICIEKQEHNSEFVNADKNNKYESSTLFHSISVTDEDSNK